STPITTSALNVSGGTANFNFAGTVTPTTVNLTSGTITGTANITISGLLTWTGGTMSGADVTNANGGVNVSTADVTLDRRTLNNSATATRTDNGGLKRFNVSNGAVFNNLAGATFNAQGSGSFFQGGGGATFNNAGTFRKSVNTGTVIFDGAV